MSKQVLQEFYVIVIRKNATLLSTSPPRVVDPVFHSQKGGHLDASQVRRIVRATAKRAGLPKKVSPHWRWHVHTSYTLDRSAPIHLVQATLGHASISTTGRYLHVQATEPSSLHLSE